MTNLFGNALQRIIQNRDPNRGAQIAFARQSGVEHYNIGRYLSGQSRPNIEVLEQICQALNEEERADLIVAYLQDEIPPSAKDLVRIINLVNPSPETARVAEEPLATTSANPLDILPKRKRIVMEDLIRECAESELAFEAFEATWRLIKRPD
jgi:transcriptional regulator with XRE-family HTH domain